MKKENQRVAISKRLLKEALLRLLEKKKIEKISITELCQEADINRATFYRHYNVPQDVLADIGREFVEKVKNVAPLPENAGDTKPYLEKFFSYIYDNADIMKIFIRSNTEANLMHMFDICALTIDETEVKTKEGGTLDKDAIKLLSSFFCGGGYYLVRAWLIDDMPKTPKEIAELIYELFSYFS